MSRTDDRGYIGGMVSVAERRHATVRGVLFVHIYRLTACYLMPYRLHITSAIGEYEYLTGRIMGFCTIGQVENKIKTLLLK